MKPCVTYKKLSGYLVNHFRTKRLKKGLEPYFCREMALLLNSGFRLTQALQELSVSALSQQWQAVLNQLSIQVFVGQSLGNAMQSNAQAFNPSLIKIVQHSEQFNQLQSTFELWAHWLEWQDQWRKRWVKLLSYPLITLLLINSALFIAGLILAPNLIQFAQNNPAYPWYAKQALLLFVNPWPLLITLLVTGCLIVLLRRPLFNFVKTKMLLFKPIRNLQITWEMSRFFCILNMLQSCHIHFDKQLQIAIQVLQMPGLKADWINVRQKILTGESLNHAIQDMPHIPPIISQFTHSLNNQHAMNLVWKKLAQYFETQTDHSVKQIEPLIQPILTLISGCIVILFIVFFILPLYQ